jgi:hypothetical protein
MPSTPTLFRIKNFEVTEDFFIDNIDKIISEIALIRGWKPPIKSPIAIRDENGDEKNLSIPEYTLYYVNKKINTWAQPLNISEKVKDAIKLKEKDYE